jgi:hypothetical protein
LSAAWTRSRRLRPEEVVLIVFTLALAVLAVMFHRTIHFHYRTFYGFAGLAVVGVLVMWAREGRVGGGWRAARDFAPFVGCVLIYENLNEFLRDLPLVDRTGWALAMDLRLFGGVPAYWLDGWINDGMTMLMAVCYSAHYFMAPLLAVMLYRQGQEAAFRNFMVAVMLTLYVGFGCYMLVPVSPPFAVIGNNAQLHEQLRTDGALMTSLLHAYSSGPLRSPRDCFPSLHTAVTLVTLVFAWRHERRLFRLLLPFGTGLVLATQYLRLHFAVDLVAAAPFAAFMIWWAPRLNAWWFRERIATCPRPPA